ncbi:5-(carboxyamino)imidazole ribonucleotide synthase [Gorillibacterium timonense]|uniref:5-(carboxyamino)imidazole ribonucleotide synthase n=1 Tax=Gorillibacterium timonense TaxID=1689269 RepID=UPI000AA19BFA|nr:5-(carboxyamino)imidazole ribonucleotide synthase [Gorillibacterium timonense]
MPNETGAGRMPLEGEAERTGGAAGATEPSVGAAAEQPKAATSGDAAAKAVAAQQPAAASSDKSPLAPRILPGSTIGVLGGGQLGRMLAIAGRAMGYRFVTLEPSADSPMGQTADRQITAAYDDAEAARELARVSHVITYEFENVDAGIAEMLAKESYVPQGHALLHTTQHRLREKRAIEAAGVPVAPYAEVQSEADVLEAIRRFGLPVVLKTATGGYDGKGQRVIRSEAEAGAAFHELEAAGTELVLEKFIRFERELSVIAARSTRGEVKAFPPAENIHKDNILHVSIAPARIPAAISRRAEELAIRLADGLQAVGLLAVEMFLTPEGELFVNELAPRPHNSGHHTIEACRTSQFEQHVRAICGLPLGSTELITPAVMVNLLGEHVEPALAWLNEQDREEDGLAVKLHLYGKAEAKPKRKMGHITLLGEDTERALAWVERSGIWAR